MGGFMAVGWSQVPGDRGSCHKVLLGNRPSRADNHIEGTSPWTTGVLYHGEKNSHILIRRCPSGIIRRNRSAFKQQLPRHCE